MPVLPASPSDTAAPEADLYSLYTSAYEYVVATSDFLVSGRETGLAYFDAETNPDIQGLAELAREFGTP